MASPATILRSRPYRSAVGFEVRTEDGLRIRGSRIGATGPNLILCHGLLGWHRKMRIVRFAEVLTTRFAVFAIDLRGHGASEGVCTYGDREILDVDAAVAFARAERPSEPVVTLEISMGGTSVLRHGGLRGGVDMVVSVSAPARWDGHTSRAVRQLTWMGSTERGRRAARAMGVRLSPLARVSEMPEDVIGRISPTPVLVVHGRDDHFFDEEEAWRLYRAARTPKRLMLAARFGHAEDGLTASLAGRLAERIIATLGRT
ncbi:MAG: lysophospholipase [Actinomycetota bacterium]|nr:lysophospholipase [Actinomycetota bacterium]